MDAPRMQVETTLNSTGSGVNIFCTEVLARSKPMKMMTMATISPATYSACPWPNGCSLSALRPAILKPSSVMTDEPASERLLKASAVMAMEWVSSPARYLAANKSMFRAMPTAPQSMPYTRRTPGSS